MVNFLTRFLYAGAAYVLLCIFPVSANAQKDGLDYYQQHKYTLAQQSLEQWYKANANASNAEALTALADCYWINRNYKNAFAIYEQLKVTNTPKNKEILKRIADIQAMKDKYDSASQTLNGIEQFNEKRKGFETHTSFLKDSGNWNLHYAALNTLVTECMPYMYNNTFILTTDREATGDNLRSVGNFSRIEYMKGNPKLNNELGYEYKHGSFEKFNDLNIILYDKKLAILHENGDVPLLKKYSYGKNNTIYDNNGQPLNSLDIKPKFLFNVGEISIQLTDSASGKSIAYFVANDNSGKSAKNYSKYDSAEVPVCIYKGILTRDKDAYNIKKAVKMSIDDFDGYLLHATVSRDGKLLVFSGKLTEGADYNLYYATRISENKWGNTIELKKNVNTYGDEVFPQLQDDGTLFFSSDGLPGLGALDVFCIPGFYHDETVNLHNNPVHLGYPLNTAFDDYGVYITHQPDENNYENPNNIEGYFTSNRAGTDDIFHFNYKRRLINYCGNIYGKLPQTGSKLLPGVTVTLISDNSEINKTVTDAWGNYCFKVEPDHDYHLEAAKDGWAFLGKSVSTPTAGNGFPNFFMDSVINKPVAGNEIQPYIGNNETFMKEWVIHHEFDETDIVAQDQNVIDSVIEFYKSTPNATVKMFSTTDCYGSVNHNDILARNRSNYIKNSLILKGVDRIVVINSTGVVERMIPCPEIRDAENIRKQVVNRYTRIFITVKKQ